MSARIKGLFSSKKKKDGRSDSKSYPKGVSKAASVSTKSRTVSIGSFASSTSAFEFQRDGTSQGDTIDAIKKEEVQHQTTTASDASKTSTSSSTATIDEGGAMTTDIAMAKLALANNDNSTTTTAQIPSSPSVSKQQKEAEAPLVSTADVPVNYSEKEMEKETITISPQSLEPSGPRESLVNTSHLSASGNRGNVSGERDRSNRSIIPAVYFDERETSRISQRQDGSFVEHRSYNSTSQLSPEQNVNDGIYLNSTTEFFPVDDQDEQVYLEQYSDEIDEFPALQIKVSKIQKQVREMRKFMRGLVQLQIEQYEPATILIQAWWRGCLVRQELKKQRVFSWHRNPKRKVKPIKYLTRAELHQSCERISTPKASLLVSEELGADKETIAVVKLQAAFRSCLVRKRVQAYRNGMRAATIIQSRWRGYWTRNLDTRLGVEQLRFRNLKVQKAFSRVSIKLQYLQGRILALEENSLPMHEAQEMMQKELEDMGDQMDTLKQDLEQSFKQLDEQVSEEKEQTTIELRGLTERIQKLEDEIKSLRSSNTSIEKQVKSLTLELPANSNLDADKSEEDDDDYEVEYDEDGNRIEKPPKKTVKRASLQDQLMEQSIGAGPRRSSTTRAAMDTIMSSSPTQMVESPVPMPRRAHRGSISSIHSQGHARTHSLNSQPPASPSQGFPRAFSASYSPTITNAALIPDGSGGAFANGVRPHSIQYPGANNNSNNPARPLTMDPNQLFRFHAAANQYIPVSPSSGPAPTDAKKYVSVDDFEYMQAEVDTLRLNNDRLEGMVRELTMRLNTLTSNMGQFYPG
ncbi:hypothetical protein BGZ80_008223 [Entomortierella chlamydospora]|uniref:Uncharacterized protein n=1 Tax=Entomortierella chlamydospora TaxID=101097 RepID=A0A9P6N508_9FUNG|nr:hypothetical protein BGZ80_008223 [Entomortierella chlamydospora]